MLSVVKKLFMLGVIILNVIMLSVVASFWRTKIVLIKLTNLMQNYARCLISFLLQNLSQWHGLIDLTVMAFELSALGKLALWHLAFPRMHIARMGSG